MLAGSRSSGIIIHNTYDGTVKPMICGCSVIIYNSNGQVLIAQRSATKKTYPLRWENIGGHLEPGETPEACIRRETREEIGCVLWDLQYFKTIERTAGSDRIVLHVFTGTIGNVEELCLQSAEIAQVKWVTRAELNGFDLAFDCGEEINEFFATFGFGNRLE